MSRADWKEFHNANTNHELDDTKNAGDGAGASLHVLDSGKLSIEVLEQSMVDQPIKGKVETQIQNERPCIFFRVQDKGNYYVTWADPDGGSLYLCRVIDGSKNRISSESSNIENYDNNKFYPHRIKFWIDSGDDLRVRWEVKKAVGYQGKVQWTKIADDLIERDPKLPGGGGIGIGGFDNAAGWDVWFDDTKIYYPD